MRGALIGICAGMIFLFSDAQAADLPRIEVRAVVPCSADQHPLRMKDSQETLCLSPNVIFGTADIVHAERGSSVDIKHGTVVYSMDDIQHAEHVLYNYLRVTLNADAKVRFAAATSAAVGRQLGILFNGELVEAPHIVEPIKSGRVDLYLGLSGDEVDALVSRLNAAQR